MTLRRIGCDKIKIKIRPVFLVRFHIFFFFFYDYSFFRGQIHSDLQHLQAGEAAESSVCDKAHTVVSNVELVQQAEAHEAGLLKSGQVVGGEVAVRRERRREKQKSC